MRWLFFVSWFLYISIGGTTMVRHEEWFNSHWGWITAVYVLAIIVSLREPDSGAMRYLFLGAWFPYLFIGLNTGSNHPRWFSKWTHEWSNEWINTHWGWFTAGYVLALIIWRREHYQAQTTQWLRARLVHLEQTTEGLVRIHDSRQAHDAYLRAGNRDEAPVRTEA